MQFDSLYEKAFSTISTEHRRRSIALRAVLLDRSSVLQGEIVRFLLLPCPLRVLPCSLSANVNSVTRGTPGCIFPVEKQASASNSRWSVPSRRHKTTTINLVRLSGRLWAHQRMTDPIDVFATSCKCNQTLN